MPKTNWSKTDRLPLALRFGVAVRLMDRVGYEAIRAWLLGEGVGETDLPSDDALRGYTEDPEYQDFANRKLDALADEAFGRGAARRAREAQPAEGAAALGTVAMRVVLQQMRDAEDATEDFQRIARQADRAELRLLQRLQAAVDAGVNILPPTDPEAELEAFQKMAGWALSPRCREPMMLAAARLPDADPNAIAMAGFWMDRRDALARDPRVLRPNALLRLVGRALSLMSQMRRAEAGGDDAGVADGAGHASSPTPSISAITGLSPTILWAMGKHAPKTQEEAMAMAVSNNESNQGTPDLTQVPVGVGGGVSVGGANPGSVAPGAGAAPVPVAMPAPALRPAPAPAAAPAAARKAGPIVATTKDELVAGLFDTIGELMGMLPPSVAAEMMRESAEEFGASEAMAKQAAARIMAGPLNGASLATLWDGMELPRLKPGAAQAAMARAAGVAESPAPGVAASHAEAQAEAEVEAEKGDSRGLPPHSRGLSGDSRALPGDRPVPVPGAERQDDPWAGIPGLGSRDEEDVW